MIKTMHNIFDGSVLITYICGNYSLRKYVIPLISWWLTGSIIKIYVKIIKGWFNQSID